MRHLISLKEQTTNDLLEILTLAQKLKAEYRAGKTCELLKQKGFNHVISKNIHSNTFVI